MTSERVHLIIHGHFYQPRRENPWLGIVERQPSAYPFHDWNERIASECYTPNTLSRLLDERGLIEGVANNFEYISFNVGPTLLEWLEREEPRTYSRILKADRISRKRNGGHGNAIAQVYNHEILPLTGEREQRREIRWGLEDFRRRFGREAEGIWLPETAIHPMMIPLLIEEKIGFIILAPHQAKRIRRIGSSDWMDVSDGSIDTARPYRAFWKDDTGKVDYKRFIDIFFFNKEISNAVSFQHLLTNAEQFAERLSGAVRRDKSQPLLVVATDGETFGHHEPFGDMCIAYFFKNLAERYGFAPTNFARYLELAPPEYEVELDEGPEGEGTSWSCAHGVARWKRDCGCSKGPAYWHARWREPLRKALDVVKRATDEVFEREAPKYCERPWDALDKYIEVVEAREEKKTEEFLEGVAKGNLSEAARSTFLRLLEAEHSSSLMFASCGWFFSEISRLEPVQNLRFAAHAINLLDGMLEESKFFEFLEYLEKAESNIPELKNGRAVYELFVKPSIYTPPKIAASYAFSVLLENDPQGVPVPRFEIEEKARKTLPGPRRSATGVLLIKDRFILEKSFYGYWIFFNSLRDIRCYVKRVSSQEEYARITQALSSTDREAYRKVLKESALGWQAVTEAVSERLLREMLAETLDGLQKEFERLYGQNRELFEIYVEAGLEPPPELRALARTSLSKLFLREFQAHGDDWSKESFAVVRAIEEKGRKYQVELDKDDVRQMIEQDLRRAAEAFLEKPSSEVLQLLVKMLRATEDLNIKIRKDVMENAVLEGLEEKVVPQIVALGDIKRDLEEYRKIRKIVDIIEELNISSRRYAGLLEEYERKVATFLKGA